LGRSIGAAAAARCGGFFVGLFFVSRLLCRGIVRVASDAPSCSETTVARRAAVAISSAYLGIRRRLADGHWKG